VVASLHSKIAGVDAEIKLGFPWSSLASLGFPCCFAICSCMFLNRLCFHTYDYIEYGSMYLLAFPQAVSDISLYGHKGLALM